MFPQAQARVTSPRPVALEGKIRACLRSLGGQKAGSSSSPKPLPEPPSPTPQSPPCPHTQCDLGELSSPLTKEGSHFSGPTSWAQEGEKPAQPSSQQVCRASVGRRAPGHQPAPPKLKSLRLRGAQRVSARQTPGQTAWGRRWFCHWLSLLGPVPFPLGFCCLRLRMVFGSSLGEGYMESST